jgi:predicted nucleotidyltransferase
MTKLDERSAVPELDAPALARLMAVLDVPGVVSALLFGSQARGRARPLSDIDVAVWLQPDTTPRDRYERQLRLISDASQALGTDEVEVVVLNDATPLLRHRAMRDGVRLLDRDRRTRVRLEVRATLEYLDTAPLRATLQDGLRRRIAEDRFGRP